MLRSLCGNLRREGFLRDLSSVHGSYKRVVETQQAILDVGKLLQGLRVRRTNWLLDQPVSNSGRLKQNLIEIARQHHWDWQVELYASPDQELKQINGITITSDGVILDTVDRWFNLSRCWWQAFDPQQLKLIDLSSQFRLGE